MKKNPTRIPNSFCLKLFLSAQVMLVTVTSMDAQIQEKIIIRAGEDVAAALSAHGLYRFPAFRRGIVKFKDGTFSKALLNYNVFLNDMQFISPKGDTLAIDEAGLIDSVCIDTDVFYYQKGYLEVVADYNDVKLVSKQTNSFQYVRRGASNLPNPTVQILSYSKVPSLLFVDNKLLVTEDVLVLKEQTYFLTYKKFKQTIADNAGFLKAFPDKKNEIRDFIDTNKIDLRSEAGIKKLLQFCVQPS